MPTGLRVERLESSFGIGEAKMSRIGDREAVVPREKPPRPYSPVGGSMFNSINKYYDVVCQEILTGVCKF